MFNFAPFIIPMAVGAFTSAAQGKDPFTGAAIGAATQGLLGNVPWGDLFGSALPEVAGNTATNAATTGIGTANMFTSAIPEQTLSQTASGLTGNVADATFVPDLLKTNPAGFVGNEAYTGSLGMADTLKSQPIDVPYQVGGVPGNAAVQDTGLLAPNMGQVNAVDQPYGMYGQTGQGYVPYPEEVETAANLKQYGAMTGEVPESKGLLDTAYEKLGLSDLTGKDYLSLGIAGAPLLLNNNDAQQISREVQSVGGIKPSQFEKNSFSPLKIKVQ
jgi:hypothetical protein